MDKSQYKQNLTEEQYEAVTHDTGVAVVMSSPGAGKCVVGETLTLTDKGLCRIDQIPELYNVVKNRVQAGVSAFDLQKACWTTAQTSHWFDFGKSATIKIYTASGLDIQGTPEHPILILGQDGELVFKKIAEIKEGDYCVVALNTNIWGSSSVEPDVAYLHGVTCSKAGKQEIPECILRAQRSAVENFLRGLFDTGATIENDGFKWIAATKTMAAQIQLMLFNLGVRATLLNKTSKTEPAVITVTGKALTKIQSLKLFRNARSKEKSLIKIIEKNTINPYEKLSKIEQIEYTFIKRNEAQLFLDRVTKTNKGREQKVYDFTVPVGHNFVANGFVNHNTRVITHRIAYLIEHRHVDPANIVAVTFTNKAASEMKQRINSMVSRVAAKRTHVSTFHSLCARILRVQHEAAGIGKNYTICDDDDTEAYVTQAISFELDEDPKKVRALKDERAPKKVKRFISMVKQELMQADDVLDEVTQNTPPIDIFYANVYKRYETILSKSNTVDFDDLIMKVVLLFRQHPDILKKYSTAIRYLLVDEYQDTNTSQYELVQQLGDVHKNIMVVGDIDQCLVDGTKITTVTGEVDIEEVQGGDVAVAAAGRCTTAKALVEKRVERAYKGTVIKIKTASGKHLTGTPGHCMFTRIPGIFKRHNLTMTMFGDYREALVNEEKDPWYPHTLVAYSSIKNSYFWKSVEEGEDIKLSDMESTYWVEAIADESYDEVKAIAKQVKRLTGTDIKHRAALTNEHYDYTPLADITEGMLVPVLNGDKIEEEAVVSVKRSRYNGKVHDLSIPDYRTFVANGIVVHNSIYAFRNANPRYLKKITEDHQDATLYKLEYNFRSTPAIAAVANALIQNNNPEFRGGTVIKTVIKDGDPVRCIELLDPRQEAAVIVDEFLTEVKRGKAEWRDFAILYRMHSRSRMFEEMLVQNNVPHKIIGGLGFYNRAVVKDLLAYMKLVLNGADDASFIRIYDRPPRGFGDVSYAKIYKQKEKLGLRIVDVFKKRTYETELKGKNLEGAEQLRSTLKCLYKMQKDKVAPLIQAAAEESGYLKMLRASGKAEDLDKVEHIDELVKAAQDFDDAHGNGLERFLEWTSLMQATDEQEDENRVQLMTCHAAKGMEFKRVYVVGAIDGVIPIVKTMDDFNRIKTPNQLTMDLEEERRIFYVALTRAQTHLTITHMKEQLHYNSVVTCTPSRFLEEIYETVQHESLADTTAGSHLMLKQRQGKKSKRQRRY